ncbi:MAG: helix-turn-helix domain-containing protein [Thermoanaerobaculia bacterium]
MTGETNFIPAEAFPPGEFLRDEMEERGWSQVDLAEVLGKPTAAVNELVLGKREITPATARSLAEAFGTSAQYWLNLESTYRLYLEAQKRTSDGAVARRAKLYEKAPVKDMIRRGWISGSSNIDVLERDVCDFLGIEAIDDEAPELAHAARKSASYGSVTPALRAWLCRARAIASTAPVSATFEKESTRRAISELQLILPAAADVRQVARILAENGIRMVVVETISKAKVDGVTMWLDDRSPVIALSLRYDRIDWFWFTLLHELVHVTRGDGKTIPIVDDLDERDDAPDSERTANAQAQEWLVPADEMNDFIARTTPLYSRVKVENFAKRIKVHPGIVVGQLQKRKEVEWSHFRTFLVKVRDLVTASTVTDGFGFAPLTF